MTTASTYPVVTAKLDLRQGIFKENLGSWTTVLEKFHEALKYASGEGNDRSQRLHHERGQLLGQFEHPLSQL